MRHQRISNCCAAFVALVLVAGCGDGGPMQPMAAAEAPSATHLGTRILHVPSHYSTIQEAVDAAREGDIVQIRPGVYEENVVITRSGIRLYASSKVVLDGSGIGGTGIHLLGTTEKPLTGVEISNLEVRNYVRGIIVQWSSHVRLHGNEIRNSSRAQIALPGVWDGRGIVVENTRHAVITNNSVVGNGGVGLTLWAGSAHNLVQGNVVRANGAEIPDHNGNGLVITGLGSNYNRLVANEVVDNNGRGIAVQRPAGPNPLVGNVVVQNRVHQNQRGGIAVMGPATETFLGQNDARGNGLSGLAPCGSCDLVDLSIGGNTWVRNLGTFNLTDPCGP